MTMTDPATTPAKPKRKATRRKRAARADVPKPAPAEFAGLTAADCCDGCDERNCVISGAELKPGFGAICGHPMKGGLQAAFQMRPDAVKRYGRAKRALANATINPDRM